jgi:tetratricopeptide (TPR) repeat protein
MQSSLRPGTNYIGALFSLPDHFCLSRAIPNPLPGPSAPVSPWRESVRTCRDESARSMTRSVQNRTDNPVLRQWGQRLHDGIHDSDLTEYLTCLINDADLDSAALVIAFEERGHSHQLAGHGSQAIADFNRAIEIDPADAWTIAQRGRTYRAMERFDEALTDFNRAIDLNPGYTWAITNRGETYRLMGRHTIEHASDSKPLKGHEPIVFTDPSP